MAKNTTLGDNSGHNSNVDVDLVDKLLNDTGCADLHYKVQV